MLAIAPNTSVRGAQACEFTGLGPRIFSLSVCALVVLCLTVEAFSLRFGFNIPTFLHASDKVIANLAKQRKKMVRFFSLTDLATVCDAKDGGRELTVAKDKLVKLVNS